MLALYYKNDSVLEVGVDEAGRGPFWGPLMAAAVLLPKEDEWTDSFRALVPQIKDSKKISEKKRVKVCEAILQHALGVGIGSVSAQEMDAHGATWANQQAFRRAIDQLNIVGYRRYVIDGTLGLESVGRDECYETVTDGDAHYLHVAAASIVAKVHHDAWVLQWCTDHPDEAKKYNLEKCKGYGTAAHRQAILDHGLLEDHRRLYLRKLIPSLQEQFPHKPLKFTSKTKNVGYQFLDDD